ncbi:hypothetical protein CDAR_618521 [Caerostris darwini]|uniref:Uncharacterized protein n=1 Tax=Caerostris darwini TaxID=1538125 RepID=A0AAV4SV97_9ARAC|nr:hypothetical protein CDAR_618521 [Caerostris darwini]
MFLDFRIPFTERLGDPMKVEGLAVINGTFEYHGREFSFQPSLECSHRRRTIRLSSPLRPRLAGTAPLQKHFLARNLMSFFDTLCHYTLERTQQMFVHGQHLGVSHPPSSNSIEVYPILHIYRAQTLICSYLCSSSFIGFKSSYSNS